MPLAFSQTLRRQASTSKGSVGPSTLRHDNRSQARITLHFVRGNLDEPGEISDPCRSVPGPGGPAGGEAIDGVKKALLQIESKLKTQIGRNWMGDSKI